MNALEEKPCRGRRGRWPSVAARVKFFAVGLVTICLTACSGSRFWYRQETPDSVTRSDLEACRSIGGNSTSICYCMQTKGYLLIPRTEAELLWVRSLQQKGLNEEEIATRLDWNEKKVLRYVDEGYKLHRTNSLGKQPVEILAKVGKPAVEPLVAALKDDDPLVRRHAAQALGEIKDCRSVEPLIATLKDADSLIRRHAVEALGKTKDLRALKPLIAVLNDEDEAAHVRMAAAEALGWLEEPSAVESLVSALKDKHWNVRSGAVKALGRIKDPRAVEPLICALEDEDATVRGYVTDALGELQDARAVEPLVAALKDTNRDVRKRAAQALAKITGEDFEGR